MVLAGGGAIRLTVECIDAELADLTGPWAARGHAQITRTAADGAPAERTDASFAADFEELLFAKREDEEDVARRCAASSPMCARAAMRRWWN